MVLEAFRCGAPVVLVSGCHYADCHYINANRQTVKRVQRLWDVTRRPASARAPELEWISAAEGQKFAKVMQRLEELRQTVTLEEIEHARQAALQPKPKKAAKEEAKVAVA